MIYISLESPFSVEQNDVFLFSPICFVWCIHEHLYVPVVFSKFQWKQIFYTIYYDSLKLVTSVCSYDNSVATEHLRRHPDRCASWRFSFKGSQLPLYAVSKK